MLECMCWSVCVGVYVLECVCWSVCVGVHVLDDTSQMYIHCVLYSCYHLM